jgi:hypothetical protein
MMEPTRVAPNAQEVRFWLSGLLDGSVDREEATRWAMNWVVTPDWRIAPAYIMTALDQLTGADAPTLDREWLFLEVDFASWLVQFDEGERAWRSRWGTPTTDEG